MKATELRAKLAELNTGDTDAEVVVEITEGQRFVVVDIDSDDNCGGKGPLIVLEVTPESAG